MMLGIIFHHSSLSVSSRTDFSKRGGIIFLSFVKGGAAVQSQTMAPDGWEEFEVYFL
jgi:hypothetical protein